EIRMILYAALLVLIMIFRPKGIMGTKEFTDFFPFRKGSRDERLS
ncbi:MAG TPA: branched-chain amino acid ABC transporter permease, partial [Clostridiales bacterium]|nr:branched-chain amino acid ABC transporter permease [Clostridiales bacterium]